MQDQKIKARFIEPMPLERAEKLSQGPSWTYDLLRGEQARTLCRVAQLHHDSGDLVRWVHYDPADYSGRDCLDTIWRIPRRQEMGHFRVVVLAAAVGFLGLTGVVAENLWGPQWAWNLGHHGPGYAVGALLQGTCFLILGLNCRASQQREHRQTLL
jgi:hypothetical protein